MQALSRISLPELAQQSSDSATLTKRSGPPLPAGTGLTLLRLMAETQARYSSQELPEGTPDMYLVEWEETTLRYGLEEFRAGLSKAIRESRFFPDPRDIEAHCAAARRAVREREAGQRIAAQVVEWRKQWEQERAEERQGA